MTQPKPRLKVFEDLHPIDQDKITRNEVTGCWDWVAGRDGGGYGTVRRHGRVLKAHRYIYELFRGPINTNIGHLDHLCRVRHCVNPDHLEPVTAQLNGWRGIASIEGDLPYDLMEKVYGIVKQAYKRGVLEGIRQAGSR